MGTAIANSKTPSSPDEQYATLDLDLERAVRSEVARATSTMFVLCIYFRQLLLDRIHPDALFVLRMSRADRHR